jgi:hypothetical protein
MTLANLQDAFMVKGRFSVRQNLSIQFNTLLVYQAAAVTA